MSNDYGANAETLAKYKRKSEFFKAQNKIAFLMFLLLICEVIASIALELFGATVQFKDPSPKLTHIKEIANGLIYVFYMLTPALVYFALKKKGTAKHVNEKPKDAHPFALFLFGLGIVYVGQLASFAMATFFSGTGVDLYAATEQTTSADPVLMIIQIINVAFLPAVLEELLARHIILTELTPYSRGFAVMVSALLFSLMHMNPIQIPFAFIAGLAMAYTTVATGSVIPSFFLHFINNTVSIVLTFLPEFTDAKTAFVTDTVITAVIMVSGAAAGIYLLKKKREKAAAEAPVPAASAENEEIAETGEEKIDVMDKKVTKNISPLMAAYIVAALVCTLLTFFILAFSRTVS